MIETPVLDTGEKVLAIEIAGNEVEQAWRIARSLVSETGRWPLATAFWHGGGATFEERMRNEDLFSRFPFEQAPNPTDVSPRGLRSLADRADGQALLAAKEARRNAAVDLRRWAEMELRDTEARFGAAPTGGEVDSARVDGAPIRSAFQLDRWLLQWERARGFAPNPQTSRQPWFDPGPCAILFLPCGSGWDALAYINWYGTSSRGAEHYVALGRSWERRFGAELVAHYGTMLQCLVSRAPANVEDAWALAREHDLVAPCTLALPGIRLRDYARALVGWERWFLHERP